MYIHAMFGLVGEIIGKFAGQLVNAGYAIDIAIVESTLHLNVEKGGSKQRVSIYITPAVLIIKRDEYDSVESNTAALEHKLRSIFKIDDTRSPLVEVGAIVGKMAGQLAKSLSVFDRYGVDVVMSKDVVKLSVFSDNLMLPQTEAVQIDLNATSLRITTASRRITTDIPKLNAILRLLLNQYHMQYNQIRKILSEHGEFRTTSTCLGQFNISITDKLTFQIETDDVEAEEIDSENFGGFITYVNSRIRQRFGDVGTLQMLLAIAIRTDSSAQLWESIHRLSSMLETML